LPNTNGVALELRHGIAAELKSNGNLEVTADPATTDTLSITLADLGWPDKNTVAAAIEQQLAPLTRPHLIVLLTTPDPTDDQLLLLWPLIFHHAAGQCALIFAGRTQLDPANLTTPAAVAPTPPPQAPPVPPLPARVPPAR
jgi:hypothetical protein